jgi:hypothetical protein
MSKNTHKLFYDFSGAHKPPAVASRLGTWCSKITAAAGSPTVQSGSGGAMELTFDNTNEVQNLCLYTGDVLPYLIGDIIRVEFLAKVTASLAASVSGFIGLGSARNDAIASIAQRVGFTLAQNVVNGNAVDGTNSQTAKATGFSLVATYRRFAIDFSVGNLTQSPPSLSKGGIADVRLFMSNDKGALVQVCPATRFDMSAYALGLQFIFQFQKTAATATGTLSILDPQVEIRRSV